MTIFIFLTAMLTRPTTKSIDSVIERLQHDGFNKITVMVDIDLFATDSAPCVHRDWTVNADNQHWESAPRACVAR